MFEVISNRDAIWLPYPRQRASGGCWEGVLDTLYVDKKTVHVCARFAAEAVLDASVDAMRLAGVS